jgi:predicted aspartyl protease
MKNLFHIKIQVKKTKINALLDSGSQDIIITVDLVKKIGLEVHGHPIPYPLGWVKNNAKIKVTK